MRPPRRKAEFDPTATSPFRHPGYEHALTDPLSSSEIGRIVAYYDGSQATDGETWIESKSRLCSGSRFIQRTGKPKAAAS